MSDLSKAMTAGFRINDGAVAWRSAGTYMCNYLPCPGGPEAGFSSTNNAHGSNPTVGLRIRAVGRVSGSFNGLPVASPSTRVTLEAWCRAPVLYKQRAATYIGQCALFACTATGRRRATGGAPPSFVSAIGTRTADVIACTDRYGVVAVRAH